MSEIETLAAIAIGIVAILHIVFLAMEMFLWTKPIGRKSFGLTEELAAATATLAKNQGLYNGFLAAGLIWAALSGTWSVQLFFLRHHRRHLWRTDSGQVDSLDSGDPGDGGPRPRLPGTQLILGI